MIPTGPVAGGSIPLPHGLSLAKARARVRLEDGVIGILVCWPIPEAERRVKARRAYSSKAKVRIGDRHVLVSPAEIVEVVSIP